MTKQTAFMACMQKGQKASKRVMYYLYFVELFLYKREHKQIVTEAKSKQGDSQKRCHSAGKYASNQSTTWAGAISQPTEGINKCFSIPRIY